MDEHPAPTAERQLRKPRARHTKLRPQLRERMARFGAAALEDHELLAVLLGTGWVGGSAAELARELVADVGSLHGLHTLGVDDLSNRPGIGQSKAARVAAGLELGVRLTRGRVPLGTPFRSGRDVDAALRPKLAHEEVEHFFVLGLDTKNRPRDEILIARGGRNSCGVTPADAFKPLLRRGALSCVLVHNHPSGDPTPSPDDIALTRRMAAAGRLLGIEVLDHVIVAAQGYFSFLDAGLMEVAPSRDFDEVVACAFDQENEGLGATP